MTSFWQLPFLRVVRRESPTRYCGQCAARVADVFIVPLTSRTTSLLAGEFVLTDWAAAGLTPTAVKRGSYGARDARAQTCWPVTPTDAEQVAQSLQAGLGLAARWGAGKKKPDHAAIG